MEQSISSLFCREVVHGLLDWGVSIGRIGFSELTASWFVSQQANPLTVTLYRTVSQESGRWIPAELSAGFLRNSPAEGFGLNFDIIETNILNLAVVIGVVIYLGGDVLKSLLNDRKEKILGTLKSANDRFLEAEQKVAEAKQKIEIAQAKAIEIRQQGKITAAQTTNTLFIRTEEEIKMLDEGKKLTLRFEEEKAVGLVRQQVVFRSIERALSILKDKIDTSVQRRLIDTGITQLGKL